MKRNLELLAPAGNIEKLKLVIEYGADAVYIGGKSFSLRSYADNFTNEELAEAVSYAHERGKKVYVTVNIFAKNADFTEAEKYFKFLEEIGADAALVTDTGFFALAKKVAPSLPIHISTQANTLNKYAVEFWRKQGASRVVLARELSINDIAEIARYNENFELEAFVHGAMCVSYSGRCLLSNYLTDRDGNRGECVQACRWQYSVKELSPYPHSELLAEEDERGTYFLNSKDLNLLENLPSLIEAGVISFKIEGRMKSEYYLATVVNAYRRAIDEYYRYGKIVNVEKYLNELNGISHRNYTKAYFLGDNDRTISYNNELNKGEAQFTGVVLGANGDYAKVEMRNRFKVGDTLELLSPSDNDGKSFTVTEIFNADGESIDDAKIVQQILSVKIPFKVKKNDILRKRYS